MTMLDICQFEIRCSDLSRTLMFFRDGLGWHIRGSGDPTYVFANPGRPPLVGLMQIANEDVPIGVTPYVLVSDAEKALEQAVALGAHPLIGRTAAGEAGFWSHALDPWGNEIAFWEPAGEWAPPREEPVRNPLIWYEIAAPDITAAVKFYRQLCGWTFQVSPGVDGFAFFRDVRSPVGVGLVGGERAALLKQLTPYAIAVDFDDTVKNALEAGGRIRVPVTTGPEGGRFVVLETPDGNPIGLFENRAGL
jgi:predicted enzyme related to lactoylglutathione lyase